jgi:hypothetical protein
VSKICRLVSSLAFRLGMARCAGATLNMFKYYGSAPRLVKIFLNVFRFRGFAQGDGPGTDRGRTRDGVGTE